MKASRFALLPDVVAMFCSWAEACVELTTALP